jgi:hypothetical protein
MTTPHPDAAADAGDQTWADLLSPARRALLVRGGLAATGLAATSASALAAGRHARRLPRPLRCRPG